VGGGAVAREDRGAGQRASASWPHPRTVEPSSKPAFSTLARLLASVHQRDLDLPREDRAVDAQEARCAHRIVAADDWVS
jgi:hypothetical protein